MIIIIIVLISLNNVFWSSATITIGVIIYEMYYYNYLNKLIEEDEWRLRIRRGG